MQTWSVEKASTLLLSNMCAFRYTHMMINKCYSFFFPADDLPYMKCPLHTVLKLTPVAYGTVGLSFFRKSKK